METLIRLDEQLFLYLNRMGTESWDGFWMTITNQWMSIPIYLILSLMILKKHWFKQAVVDGVFIIGLVMLSIGISHLFKYGVMRPRPCAIYDTYTEMRFPLRTIGKGCGDFGFYSTHASVGMALMLFIGMTLKRYYKWILWPLMIWVAFFCYSRIYVGKHFPSDLIVGVLMGAIFGPLFYQIRVWVRERFKV